MLCGSVGCWSAGCRPTHTRPASSGFGRRPGWPNPEIPPNAANNLPLAIESRVLHNFLWSNRILVLCTGECLSTVFCGHTDGGPTTWSGVRKRSLACARCGQTGIPPPRSAADWACRRTRWWARRTGSICRRDRRRSAATVHARRNHVAPCRARLGRRCHRCRVLSRPWHLAYHRGAATQAAAGAGAGAAGTATAALWPPGRLLLADR
jgi:hypothetical protein